MDIATVGTVMDNLKMDQNKPVLKFAAKMNSNFSQLKELIPRGQFNNIPATPAVSINISNISSSLDYQKQSCNLWLQRIRLFSQRLMMRP